MRIIAGEGRGIQLKTLPGQDTRPTLERVKEGMFSAVQFWVPGARVLDLYAGSGQLGLEAVSRGASFCLFVENGKQAAQLVHQNIEAAGFGTRCRLWQTAAEAFLANPSEKFDLVLLDPPYGSGVLPGLLSKLEAVCNPRAQLLCETDAKLAMPQTVGRLVLQKQYRYGTVTVWRYCLAEE